jgi:hypothetical protein
VGGRNHQVMMKIIIGMKLNSNFPAQPAVGADLSFGWAVSQWRFSKSRRMAPRHLVLSLGQAAQPRVVGQKKGNNIMKKGNFQENHREFENWINWYFGFTFDLFEERKIFGTRFEKAEFLEAFLLRVVTRWEYLIEKDILISVNHDSSKYANYLGLVLPKHLSMDECEAIITGHRYLDFKSVGDVKSFGKKYLVPEFNPFTAITTNNSKIIDELIIMRNYLAHYSNYSRRTYYNYMRKKLKYSRVPEPGIYLLSYSAYPRKTYRWYGYLMYFINTSKQMLKSVNK